jgi:hypothetical protein
MSDSNGFGGNGQGVFSWLVNFVVSKLNPTPHAGDPSVAEPSHGGDGKLATTHHDDLMSVAAHPTEDFKDKSAFDSHIKFDFHMGDDGPLSQDVPQNGSEASTGAVNQNSDVIKDSSSSLADDGSSPKGNTYEDVLFHAENTIPGSDFDPGRILSFDTLTTMEAPLEKLPVANDLGHNVVLEASDILDMGNNLIITGHELDSVNFQDEGWTKIDHDESYLAGVEPREGYNTYVHESGAVVQIESVIHTNFDHDGL